jgi:hypothetical protein
MRPSGFAYRTGFRWVRPLARRVPEDQRASRAARMPALGPRRRMAAAHRAAGGKQFCGHGGAPADRRHSCRRPASTPRAQIKNEAAAARWPLSGAG